MPVHFLVYVAVAILGGSPQAAPRPDEVLQREQQRIEYLTTGKIDQLAEMLSPTLTYGHSSGLMDTRDRILANLRSGQVVYRSLKHRDVQVRFVTPDVAILNGESDIEVVNGGQPQLVPVRFTLVYVRKNGAWLMEAWQSARRPPA